MPNCIVADSEDIAVTEKVENWKYLEINRPQNYQEYVK